MKMIANVTLRDSHRGAAPRRTLDLEGRFLMVHETHGLGPILLRALVHRPGRTLRNYSNNQLTRP